MKCWQCLQREMKEKAVEKMSMKADDKKKEVIIPVSKKNLKLKSIHVEIF